MNIENLYYSRENFGLLNKTISQYCKQKYKKEINVKQFKDKLFLTMETVESNAGLGVPQGFTTKKYLELMNKKVLKLAMPHIVTTFRSNKLKSKPKSKPKSNTHLESVFQPFRPIERPQMSNTEIGPTESVESYEDLVKKRNYKPTKELKEQFSTQDNLNNLSDVHRQGTPIQELINNNTDKISEEEKGTSIHDLLAKQQDERSVFDRLPDPNQESVSVLDQHLTNIHSINLSTRDNIQPPGEDFNIHNNFKEKDEAIKKQFEEMTKSREQLDGSFPLIQQPKIDYKIRKHYLSIDSIDRDLELYPNPTDFRVQFNAESDSIKHITRYYTITLPSGVKEKKILYTGGITEAGIRAAPIQETIKNIKSIKLINVTMPVTRNGVYTFNDEQNLFINIPELDNKYLGTNIATNNAFVKVIDPDRLAYYVSGINNMRKYSQMKTIEDDGFVYDPAPRANLNSMTLQVKNNRNFNYSIGNDKLEIISIIHPQNGPGTKTYIQTGCTDNPITYLALTVKLKLYPGMTDDDILYEFINNEIIYIYSRNTCYNNQYFNFDLDTNIETTFNPTSMVLIFRNNLTCEDLCEGDENNLPQGESIFMEFINTNQILKLTDSNGTGYYRYKEKTEKGIKLTLISGTVSGLGLGLGLGLVTITSIAISEVVQKGIQSEDCCCINYVNGIRVIDTKLKTNNSNFRVDTSEDECVGYYCHTFYIPKPKNFTTQNEYGNNDCELTEEFPLFLVRKRKQLSYTFEVESVENNRGVFESQIL